MNNAEPTKEQILEALNATVNCPDGCGCGPCAFLSGMSSTEVLRIMEVDTRVALYRVRIALLQKERDELKERCQKLVGDLDSALKRADNFEICYKVEKNKTEAFIKAVKAYAGTVGFFSSVIKSGEDWTGTCQDAYDKCQAAYKEAVDTVAGSVKTEQPAPGDSA